MTEEEIRKHFAANRFMQECGMTIEKMGNSESFYVKAEVMPKYFNGSARIHGGYLYTIADTVGGVNVRRYASKLATLDSDFHFLCNESTRYVYGYARLIRNGSKVIVMHVEVRGDSDQVFAEGTFTYYKFD